MASMASDVMVPVPRGDPGKSLSTQKQTLQEVDLVTVVPRVAFPLSRPPAFCESPPSQPTWLGVLELLCFCQSAVQISGSRCGFGALLSPAVFSPEKKLKLQLQVGAGCHPTGSERAGREGVLRAGCASRGLRGECVRLATSWRGAGPPQHLSV